MTAESSTSRPLNPVAARQAWRELPVRVAALIAIGVILVVLSVGVNAIAQGVSDRRLLVDGTKVVASLDFMEGASRAADRTVRRLVRLSYLLPTDPSDAPRRQIEGYLTPMPGQLTTHETPIPIIVDPNDNLRWTDRVEPEPWLHALLVPLLLTPLALATIAVMIWQRARILRVFQTGTMTSANVVDLHKSALVPSGKVMKVAPLTAGGRVLTLTRPNRLGDAPTRSEQVEVIIDDAARPRRALLAAAYAE